MSSKWAAFDNLNKGKMSIQQKMVIAVSFLTSANSIFFKLSSIPAMAFVSYRFMISAFIFLIWSLLFTNTSKLKEQLNLKKSLILFFTGFVFAFGAFVYFIALKTTAVSSVLILTSSAIIFMTILSFLFLKEKINKREALSLLIAFIGCVIVTLTKTGGINSIFGNTCALTCALCCSIYMVVMKWLSDIDMPTKLFITYLGSFVFSVSVALGQGVFLQAYSPKEYMFILGSAILSVCIPQSVINWALKSVSVTFAGSITLAEPIIGSVYAFIIWNEAPKYMQIVGGIFVLGGLFIYYRNSRYTK